MWDKSQTSLEGTKWSGTHNFRTENGFVLFLSEWGMSLETHYTFPLTMGKWGQGTYHEIFKTKLI